MKKFRLAGAAAIAGVVTLLSSGVAQAYPECGIDLQLSDSTLVGGGSFDFTADAGTIDCAWVVTYRGETRIGEGTSFSGSFTTPEVSKKTTSKIKADCTYDDEAVSSSPAAASSVAPAFYSSAPATNVQAAVRTCSTSAVVTLLPEGGVGGDGDGLPDTGGSNLSLILLGGGLVVVGGGVVYVARRRQSHH